MNTSRSLLRPLLLTLALALTVVVAPAYAEDLVFATADGAIRGFDPVAWSIVDGKLYLNDSLDVREKWRRDIPGYIDKANANWPGVLN